MLKDAVCAVLTRQPQVEEHASVAIAAAIRPHDYRRVG